MQDPKHGNSKVFPGSFGNFIPMYSRMKPLGQPTSEIAAMLVSLNTLVNVFREIVAQDYSGKDWPYISSTVGELSDEQTMEHRIVCDFCNGDIFQAFFECSGCHWRYTRNTEETPFSYTLCPGCYVDGRRCACLEAEPKQCFPRKELKRVVEEATAVIQEYEADWQPNKLFVIPIMVLQCLISALSFTVSPSARPSNPRALFANFAIER